MIMLLGVSFLTAIHKVSGATVFLEAAMREPSSF